MRRAGWFHVRSEDELRAFVFTSGGKTRVRSRPLSSFPLVNNEELLHLVYLESFLLRTRLVGQDAFPLWSLMKTRNMNLKMMFFSFCFNFWSLKPAINSSQKSQRWSVHYKEWWNITKNIHSSTIRHNCTYTYQVTVRNKVLHQKHMMKLKYRTLFYTLDLLTYVTTGC